MFPKSSVKLKKKSQVKYNTHVSQDTSFPSVSEYQLLHVIISVKVKRKVLLSIFIHLISPLISLRNMITCRLIQHLYLLCFR